MIGRVEEIRHGRVRTGYAEDVIGSALFQLHLRKEKGGERMVLRGEGRGLSSLVRGCAPMFFRRFLGVRGDGMIIRR